MHAAGTARPMKNEIEKQNTHTDERSIYQTSADSNNDSQTMPRVFKQKSIQRRAKKHQADETKMHSDEKPYNQRSTESTARRAASPSTARTAAASFRRVQSSSFRRRESRRMRSRRGRDWWPRQSPPAACVWKWTRVCVSDGEESA
jgi:hypothetical protein